MTSTIAVLFVPLAILAALVAYSLLCVPSSTSRWTSSRVRRRSDPQTRVSRFLQTEASLRMVEAIRRMEEADNPRGLKAARICFPPPLRRGIATSLHSLIWSIFFAVIDPVLGIAFIALTFGISFGYTWPKAIRRTIEMSPSR